MRVGILGPAEAVDGAGPVDLGTRKQRALLAALALHRGRPVAVDTIVDLLWPDRAPAGVTGTLQAYVANLRRALEPNRPARAPATLLVTLEPGYALKIRPDDVDATSFEQLAGHAHRALAGISLLDGGPPPPATTLGEAADALARGLSLWRGTPYAELTDAPDAVAERARLDELRLLALEDLAVARLARGEHAAAAADLEALTAAHPLRERLWALRAVALTRSGRQADALDIIGRVRELLAEELGLEPGPELRRLQAAVLRQDPALDWVPPQGPVAVAGGPPAGRVVGPAAQASTAGAAAAAPVAPAPTATAALTVMPADRFTALPRLPAWPMVGRSRELIALTGLLDTAGTGTPSFAAVVGEPGIGKSRLCHELTALAAARGAHVLVGRCSQDDGAPPLWPWAAVLKGLGQDLPATDGEDEGASFRTWTAVVGAVADAAAARTTLVVLDDLHRADPASLRVLRLLVEAVETAHLLVVATWHAHPEPTGLLAEAAGALARRHALRLHLTGLGADEAGEVVAAVAGSTPSGTEADALRRRTDGNPFFLVEYARLARERRDLSALLAEPDPPSAVRDVLLRRLARLPEATSRALRAAAVVGRRFDTQTLAAATGTEEDEVLDVLDPALAAGLVRDEGVDQFSFSHSLVRDTVRAVTPSSRRARLHARVAAHLAGLPDREAEVAHHWLAAGPAHAPAAWRAASAAARSARRLHAHEQAADLLRSALDAHARDPAGNDRERFELLLDLVDAYRWAADWRSVVAVTGEAFALADGLGDAELLARAASAVTLGALWQSTGNGQVNSDVVGGLRRALAGLSREDSPLRCRALLSLANETYYGSSVAEREAMVGEALAMADRLGDDALLMDAYEIAFVTLWRPASMAQRLSWAREGEALARRLGNHQALVVARTLHAVVLGELGRVPEMWPVALDARALATRMHLPYGLLVLDNLEVPWLAMAGRFEEAQRRLDGILERHRVMDLPQSRDAANGSLLALRLWQGRSEEVLDMLLALAQVLPATTSILCYHLRAGQVEEARAYLADHPVVLEHDTWFSLMDWGMAAEASLGLGLADVGAAVRARLRAYAGCSCSAGSGNAMGPVDAYLAMAAAAAGDLAGAARHADDAARLCAEWEIPLAARWFAGVRERHGF